MLCILVPICLLMVGISIIITVHTYRANKKDLDTFTCSNFSKVFSTKLCDSNTVNCDVSHFTSRHSFETLVDDIFINGG